MNCDKKIVFFDIDGTLYLYNKGIPEDTKKALKLLRENGHIPVLCTGRTKAMIFNDVLDMKFDAIIAGAGTYLEYDGKVIYSYEMDSDKARNIVLDMKKSHILPIAEGIEKLYYVNDMIPDAYKNIIEIYKREIGNKIVDWKEDMPLHVSKVSGKTSEGSDVEKMRSIWGDEFKFVFHGGKLLELIPKEYSKAYGIERLLECLGGKMEDTYAFGDSMNDYEMLTFVEHGVAMGNSTEELKSKITNVTDDFDKGGIWNSLKKFGLI